MRKFIILLSVVLLTAMISGCDNTIASTPKPTATSTSTTTQPQDNCKKLYNDLKSEYDSILNTFDDSIKTAINTYCEKYLTYTGNATDNISDIKDIVTDSYYNELNAQAGHQQGSRDYAQATGFNELYYSKPLSPYDTVNVAALCKQTTVFNDKTDTKSVVYVFKMQYQNAWKINSVETRS